MYRFAVVLFGALRLAAQPQLYACATSTQDYVVGAKLPPSGLFRMAAEGRWQHLGYNHPLLFGITADPGRANTLLVAAGNGMLRITGDALDWRQMTGADITELRDVDTAANAIYIAHTAGIRVSEDGGMSWRELAGSLRRKYTETIRADRVHRGVLLAGTETGVYRSEDAGASWRPAGAVGWQVLRLEASPHDGCFWLAATQGGGLFASHDCGVTFESEQAFGVGRNLYDIAFDPKHARRIAVAGFGPGVAVSEDLGKTWTVRAAGLPRPDGSSVAFDAAGRLYAAIHDAGVFVSDDAGVSWRGVGLEKTHVYRLRFVEVRK